MSGDDDIQRDDDVAQRPGKIADPDHVVLSSFDEYLIEKYEFYSYRNAAVILKNSYQQQYREIVEALRNFQIDTSMIRMPGGNKGPIAKRLEASFSPEWRELRIAADLKVSLYPAKKTKNAEPLQSHQRKGYFDGHRIDLVRDKVALDIEWNSKDQTYDRDLYAFGAFYEAGAIALGIIVTRGFSLDENFFRSLGPVLEKDGSLGSEPTAKKFGASTTWMGKLLYRLEAGRNGGCPVLAIGITKNCVSDLS